MLKLIRAMPLVFVLSWLYSAAGEFLADIRSEKDLKLKGPIGGSGGKGWDDTVYINSVDPNVRVNFTPHRRIAEIRASCGDRPDSLQFIYRDNYYKVGVTSEITKTTKIHGKATENEGQQVVFPIDAADMITDVWIETCRVRHAASKRTLICHIKIETVKKTGDNAFQCGESTWKDKQGNRFPATWSGGNDTVLFAFTGSSGAGIDQLSSWWGTKEAYGMGGLA